MYFIGIYSAATATLVAALEAAHTLRIRQHCFATEWLFQYDNGGGTGHSLVLGSGHT